MAYDFIPNGTTGDALSGGDIASNSPNFTISATITPDVVDTRSMIVSKWDTIGESHREFVFEINSDATLRVFVSTDGTFQVGNVVSSTGTLTAGVETSVIFVMDGSNTDMTLYINGVQDGQNTTGPASVFSGAARFLIGAEDSGANITNPFDGRIAEVGVWSRALSAAEAAILGQRYSPLFISNGLQHSFPIIRELNDSIGSVTLSLVDAPAVAPHPRVIYPAPSYSVPPITTPAVGFAHSQAVLIG